MSLVQFFSIKRNISSITARLILLILTFSIFTTFSFANETKGMSEGGETIRANGIRSRNLALSLAAQEPTTFANIVSLNDPDVVGAAENYVKTLSNGELYYEYFRFYFAINKVRSSGADKLDIPAATYRVCGSACKRNPVIGMIGVQKGTTIPMV